MNLIPNSVQSLDFLYKENKWDEFSKYEYLFEDKIVLARNYNATSKSILKKKSFDSLANFVIARMFSQKALNLVKEKNIIYLKQDSTDITLQKTYNIYLEDYASIIFKLGLFDSAYFYQKTLFDQGVLEIKGIENLSIYMEKVNGMEAAKLFIEKQLILGLKAPSLVKQLETIYKKLELPISDFDRMVKMRHHDFIEENEKKVRIKFGTTKATNFKLTNLYGETVKLNSLKGKVIVLDFWASWCAPCLASFPEMQSLVNSYKQDTSVVFLFIDVLENMSIGKMKDKALDIIKANKYDFNVLFDAEDKLVTYYKIEEIPTKIVIDKKGDIVCYGNSIPNVSQVIDFVKQRN